MAAASAPASNQASSTGPGRQRRIAIAAGLELLFRELGCRIDISALSDGLPWNGGRPDLRRLAARGKDVGLDIECHVISKRRLARLAPPFLLLGDDDRAWLVRERRGSRLVLIDAVDGQGDEDSFDETAAYATAIRLAQTIVQVRPAATAPRGSEERPGAFVAADMGAETGVETPVDATSQPGTGDRWRNNHAAPAEPRVKVHDSTPEPDRQARGDRHQNRAKKEKNATAEGGLWRQLIKGRIRPALFEIAVASVFINIIALATPLFMMTVYNKVINHAALATLDVLAIGMITLVGFELLLRATRGSVVARAGAKLDILLSREVMRRLMAMPQSRFERTPSGLLTERLRQLDQLRGFLTGNLPLLIVDLAFVSLFVAAIFFLSPVLGWITLAVMPAFILVSALAHRRQRKLIAENFRAVAGKSSSLSEAVNQSLTVKALALEGEMERRFEERQLQASWTGLRAAGLGHIVGSTGQALQHLAGLAVIYVGAQLIIAGQMSIGALIACTILSARALSPMRQLFFAWHQLQQARDALVRLDELFGEAVSRETGRLELDSPLRGRIVLEGVYYRYGEGKILALEGLDLTIEPGRMLAIIGPPGSGKSTLAKLLVGLEQPTGGRVMVDGHDLAHLAPSAYRQQIAMVPQEVQLFAGTIAENIFMAAEDQSLARVVAAAKFVGLHDIVQRLPEGYETRLSERGGGLSLGQRQLVSIARALVRNPRILVLDEATSALDGATENRLMSNLQRAAAGRTVIMVTHRRSVIERCHRAAFLHKGVLVSEGEPAEVMRRAEAHARNSALQTVN